MIKITVCKEEGNIVSITAKGHSNYKEEGSDIICSAVSSILQTAILGLESKIGRKSFSFDIKPSNKEPITKIELKKDLSEYDKNISSIILDTAFLGLKSISNEYSRYVKLEDN